MRERLIIGFAGYVGSGKTSLSNYFVQNNGFVRLSFAAKIKEIMVVLGVSETILADPVLKEKPHPALCGVSPRAFMEALGKMARDLTDGQLWLQQFVLAAQPKHLIICDDVRHQNEADLIRENGGYVFRLRVPGTQPRVPTDFKVDELTGVEDLTNDIGTTLLKHLYQFTYAKAFEQIAREMSYGDWKAQQ